MILLPRWAGTARMSRHPSGRWSQCLSVCPRAAALSCSRPAGLHQAAFSGGILDKTPSEVQGAGCEAGAARGVPVALALLCPLAQLHC